MKIIYLNPKSTFPFLSSDSIFGALTYAVSELFPDKLLDFLDSFKDKNNIPFLISSAFPCIKLEENYLKFYPKPMDNLNIKDISLAKDFKKIKFIEEEIFLDLVSGNIDYSKFLINFKDEKYLLNKNNESFLIKNENKNMLNDNFFSKEVSPHNVIDRFKNNSINIFYAENYRFKENKYLFFLVKFMDESYEEIFLSALNFLKDRGFGKDISTGSGHFDYEIDDFNIFDDINNSQKGQYFINLSRFIPDKEDLNNLKKHAENEESCLLYEFGDKRVRDSFGLRDRTRFFKEGSVFPYYSHFTGSLVNTSDHSIEYGYSFNIRYDMGEF